MLPLHFYAPTKPKSSCSTIHTFVVYVYSFMFHFMFSKNIKRSRNLQKWTKNFTQHIYVATGREININNTSIKVTRLFLEKIKKTCFFISVALRNADRGFVTSNLSKKNIFGKLTQILRRGFLRLLMMSRFILIHRACHHMIMHEYSKNIVASKKCN